MNETGLNGVIGDAAGIIAASSHVVAMTGAGMSVESGIPTFRGAGGIWSRHGTPAPDAYSQFLQDPDAFWERQHSRRSEPWIAELRTALDAALPNPGHVALAGLEQAGVLQTIVTQNIDGLHQDAGSQAVIEIHGSRYKLRCIDCGSRTPREELFMKQAPPPCETCGGRVKFDSVLFGEPIPEQAMSAARAAADASDCVLVIGTSATVRPAGGLPRIAHANGATLIEVNTSETALSKSCDVVIRGKAAEVLPLLAGAVGALLNMTTEAGTQISGRTST